MERICQDESERNAFLDHLNAKIDEIDLSPRQKSLLKEDIANIRICYDQVEFAKVIVQIVNSGIPVISLYSVCELHKPCATVPRCSLELAKRFVNFDDVKTAYCKEHQMISCASVDGLSGFIYR